MHYEDLRQIVQPYDHIYLSPHLDDAALSCGGAIARHSADGARVLVATICTGAPAATDVFSPFAHNMHVDWGLSPDQAVTARLREDAQAMERLGADSLWVGQLDAIYRRPDAYDSNRVLFGTPAQDDPLGPTLVQFIAGLASRSPDATFYAPLGVGFHVDHQITHIAAAISTGATVAFYEDFPYVTVSDALHRRVATLKGSFVSSTIDIEPTLARKVGAISAYSSQISTLFGDDQAMEQSVTSYAGTLCSDTCAYAERLWLLAPRELFVAGTLL